MSLICSKIKLDCNKRTSTNNQPLTNECRLAEPALIAVNLPLTFWSVRSLVYSRTFFLVLHILNSILCRWHDAGGVDGDPAVPGGHPPAPRARPRRPPTPRPHEGDRRGNILITFTTLLNHKSHYLAEQKESFII